MQLWTNLVSMSAGQIVGRGDDFASFRIDYDHKLRVVGQLFRLNIALQQGRNKNAQQWTMMSKPNEQKKQDK